MAVKGEGVVAGAGDDDVFGVAALALAVGAEVDVHGGLVALKLIEAVAEVLLAQRLTLAHAVGVSHPDLDEDAGVGAALVRDVAGEHDLVVVAVDPEAVGAAVHVFQLANAAVDVGAAVAAAELEGVGGGLEVGAFGVTPRDEAEGRRRRRQGGASRTPGVVCAEL